jgi:SAM-dependent methyltransferase
MRVNAWRWRILSPRSNKPMRAHLGPGQNNYIPGWVNVDANLLTAKVDIWANLSDGLPFRANSLDAVYSHHVIEHLPDLHFHFRELFRCLRPGAAFRVGGPHGDMAMRKYVAEQLDWFSDFPEKRDSLGGRLENFIFCRGEHLTILTPSYLQEIAIRAGFTDLRIVQPNTETSYPQVFGLEVLKLESESTPDAPHTLLMEGIKPA